MSTPNTQYIPPLIRSFEKFQDLLDSQKERPVSFLETKKNKASEHILEDLLAVEKAIILAEPGYGKTRLLRELKKFGEKKSINIAFVDLKLFSKDKSLEQFVIQQAGESKLDAFKTICLDALDEVRQDSFQYLVQEIKNLNVKFPTLKLIVSCRSLYYEKFPVFESDKFTYYLIAKFEFELVREYLRNTTNEHGERIFSDNEIESIVQDFKEPNWESIILIPRYLEKFVEFRRQCPTERPTRSSLYDFFVNERLSIEDGKRGAQDQVIIRRVLEKVALVMEIYQKNEIKKEELLTILEEINSAMAVNFLDMGKLEILFKHSLWKDLLKTIAFEDHTLQEYLASCELLRLGGQRVLYDFTVDSLINDIHPSWFYTLEFCVDQDVSLLEQFLDFGQKEKSIDRTIESDDYRRFLTKVNVAKLDAEGCGKIFKKVFDQYQRELVWIEWDIGRRLASFFDLSLEKYLREWLEIETNKAPEINRNIIKGNVVHIIGEILRHYKLPPDSLSFWRSKLIELVNDENENGVLQRNALFALQAFRDESLIKEVQKVYQHPSSSVRDAFIDFCAKTAPNSVLSIDYFIKEIENDDLSTYGSFAIGKITSIEGIEYLIKNLSERNRLLEAFLRHDEYYFKEDTLFKKIEEQYRPSIKPVLLEIIFRAVRLHRHNSSIIKYSVNVLKKKDNNFINEICDKIINSEEYAKYVFEFDFLFRQIVSKESLKIMFEKLKRIDYVKTMFFHILFDLKSKGQEGLELYELGRSLMPEHYSDMERRIEQGKSESEADVNYKELCRKLEPEPGKYSTDVFDYFCNHYDTIKDLLKLKDVNRIIELATHLLKITDPTRGSFKVIAWDKENKSISQFSISSCLILFEHCLRVSKFLSIETDATIRKNLINFIPFAQESTSVEMILKMVGDVDPKELGFVLKVYTSDIAKYYRVDNFLKIVDVLKLLSAIPILKAFVADAHFSNYEKESALELIGKLEPDLLYFQEVFKNFYSTNKALAFTANALIIKFFNNHEAVKTRIKEIMQRKFTHVEPDGHGAHFVADNVSELHGKEFARVLTKLTSDEFLDDFIILLKFSFEILETNKNYWSYAQYIWEIFYGYMENIKLNGKYEPIKTVEEFIRRNETKYGMNWFGKKFKELRRNYQLFIGVPKTVLDSIKIYNRVKQKQYLDICSQKDLRFKVKDIVDGKLRLWIEKQGAKDLFYYSKSKSLEETKIQKFVYVMLKAELEKLGIIVLREPQKLDDERVDFFISYGFAPNMTIVIETKRSNHGDLGVRKNLTKLTSHKKLTRYMKGYNSIYGIFLIFNIHCEVSQWKRLLENIEKHYTKIDNIEVVGIDACN